MTLLDAEVRGAPGSPASLSNMPYEELHERGGAETLHLHERASRISARTRHTSSAVTYPRTRRTSHATLKSWRLLRKLRCGYTRVTDIVKARPIPALQLSASA